MGNKERQRSTRFPLLWIRSGGTDNGFVYCELHYIFLYTEMCPTTGEERDAVFYSYDLCFSYSHVC